ncbi:MAG TPA: motility-associated protein [Kofleriaceae bacterium]|nr:motility-associated protein [Kofleriaceae bacterium]
MAPVGILVVFGCVLGGFLMAGGALPILIQPPELIVIVGAAIGTLIISSPGLMKGRVKHVFTTAFKDVIPKKKDYLDLLKLMYELFMLARRQGVLALESHAAEPTKSDLFKKYPVVARDEQYRTFLAEALQHMANGVSADDLEALLDAELETLTAYNHLAGGLVRTVSDALPGIGIVAAVLGVIVTMGHMNAPPAIIGHHIAAALVGTFLGILLSYGIVSPIVLSVEIQEVHQRRFLDAIKASVIAVMRGAAPATAVEFGRKMIFIDERPSFLELDKGLQSLKGS